MKARLIVIGILAAALNAFSQAPDTLWTKDKRNIDVKTVQSKDEDDVNINEVDHDLFRIQSERALDDSLELVQIPFDWIDISTTGINTGLVGDDQTLGPFPIGFDFPWWGGSVNQIYFCSNGWATFAPEQGYQYTNSAIPNTGIPNDLVAVYWDDFNIQVSGSIYYEYDAVNERFIGMYLDCAHFNSPV